MDYRSEENHKMDQLKCWDNNNKKKKRMKSTNKYFLLLYI